MSEAVTEKSQQECAGFSLGRWQAAFAKRCTHSSPGTTGTLQAVATTITSGAVEQTAATRFPCSSDEKSADSDFLYLSSLFQRRDAGRMEETVLPIARLLWAKDVENAKHLLVLARDGLLSLAEEAWSLLQQRHPGVQPHLAKPDVICLSAQLPSFSTPRQKKTVLLPGTKWRSCADAESCSSDTSTRACSPALSRTTFASTPTCGSMAGFGKDRLLKVVSIEEGGLQSKVPDEDEAEELGTPVQDRLLKVADIGEEEEWFGSLNGYRVCNCPCAGRGKGSGRSSRSEWVLEDCAPGLEWELQFMLTGRLDEVFQSLLHNPCSATVGQATLQLEKLREDVLEWTVKRWNS